MVVFLEHIEHEEFPGMNRVAGTLYVCLRICVKTMALF